MPAHPVPSPEERIRRAFDAAVGRMCAARTTGDLEDELSNMLHHLYRLAELRGVEKKDRPPRVPDGLMALRWIRNRDTHDLLIASTVEDVYSDYYTQMYGVLVWADREGAGLGDNKYGLHEEYDEQFVGRPVLDTTAAVFTALEASPPLS